MYFRPKVVYPVPEEPRDNSILRYVGYRVLRNNKNFLCLDKDTKLYGYDKTLDELYKSGKDVVDTLSLTKAKGTLGMYYPIKSQSWIIPTGQKEVFEIELENGKKVYASAEHKFFKKNKHSFEEASVNDLKVGDSIRDYNPDHLKKFYDLAKDRSKRKIDKTIKKWKTCERCTKPFPIDRGYGKFSQKYCTSCKEEVGRRGTIQKYREDNWYEWEDNIIRNYYPCQSRSQPWLPR